MRLSRSLNINQKDIAIKLGEGHSDEINKFENVEINQQQNAITIQNASREVVCEVMEIIKLQEVEEDNLVYARVISYKENNDNFLNYVAFFGKGE